MRTLLIRLARPDRDAAEMVALHRAVLGEGRYFITRPFEFSDTADRRAAFLQHIAEQDNAVCYVARLDGVLAGMVSIRGGRLTRMRHVGKLEIFVDRRFRGQGVGRELMAEAMTWARESPLIQKVGLSVFADNTRAVLMYKGLGFEIEGHRKGEYREVDGTLRDDLLMCCWVDASG